MTDVTSGGYTFRAESPAQTFDVTDASVYVWTGAVDGKWMEPGNWTVKGSDPAVSPSVEDLQRDDTTVEFTEVTGGHTTIDLEGLDVISNLIVRAGSPKYTFGTSADLSQAISDGAAGVILKDSATKTLVEAIHPVAAGETYISAELLRMAEEDAAALQLTDHQKAILASVVRGFTNADIARQFGIQEQSVKEHIAQICTKIGAANRTEAVAIALRKHLLKI